MSRGKSDKITYKPYEQNQMYLIPPSADELIPENHLVRLVSATIDEMGILRLLERYRVGGGASRYHPVMMTKLFVYGYLNKVCSSRMLAKAARENVMYMWLSGGQKPDFRTLNDFRGKLLRGVMEEIFVSAVKMLVSKGYIKHENYFYDGTKVESASGCYTFVWKKTVERNDKQLDEKLRAYIRMAEQVWEDENSEYGDLDLEELGGKAGYTSDDVKELASMLRERLEKLEAEEDKKTEKGFENDRKRVFTQEEEVRESKKNMRREEQLFQNGS